MFDSHCHLADEAFALDLGAVVARALAAGLSGAVCIIGADDAAEVGRAVAVREAWPAVSFATAVHPHRAGGFAGRAAEAARATANAARDLSAVAIGELGLDYHYDFAPKAAQQDVLAAQVAQAVELDLPIIVHTREAMADTVAVIRESGGGRARGVMHCFTGTADEARMALDLGFFISFAGILTFPRADGVREAAAVVPMDRLLVETDAPYLAPIPHRGSRNEPAWVALTLARLAEVKGVSPDDLALAIDENGRRLLAPCGRAPAAAPAGLRFVDTPLKPMA
jgi:TatD DNase family protein